jgi:thiol:disulfide interchange protein DsbD
MVGDWTQRDTTISSFLNRYQHAGVPLYVLFDRQGNDRVLPQLLTPALVIDALETVLAEPIGNPSPGTNKDEP